MNTRMNNVPQMQDAAWRLSRRPMFGLNPNTLGYFDTLVARNSVPEAASIEARAARILAGEPLPLA